jgi:DNA (cytosine-5)-methyltransferase 1
MHPLKKNNHKSFTFIDLFAGVGGIRLPFEELGGDCVFTSEMDKYCQITYKHNYGGEVLGDITKITNTQIPHHDILVGGFPCQAFSHAGKKLGFEDTRGTLFFEIARIIKSKKPKMFLLENVKGLVGHDQGKTFKTILEVLNKLKYEVSFKVLHAKDFGVPQNRPRIYIVGIRKDLNFKFEFPEQKSIKTNLGSILESKVDKKYTLSDTLWKYLQERKKIQQAKGNGFGFNLYDKDSEYVSTISARYGKDGSEILINQKGKNPRKLTPRECARLQGFPENMEIVVSDTQFYKQMGNSVAVPVIRYIAQAMIKQYQKELTKNS